MYLSTLTISRFRSCEEATVDFQKELTVLVGENNGGKSNILDAIRLLTAPLNGRRERYAEDADLRRGANPSQFELRGEYSGLSDTLKGLLISAVPDPTRDLAIFGCRYEPEPENGIRGRFTSWAGEFDTTEPEGGSTDLIRHVYLPALRDAHQALGSRAAARVMALFRHFLPKEQEQQFVDALRRGEDMPDVLTQMNREIGGALQDLTSGVRPQSAEVNFASEDIQDIARDLRFKLGDSGTSLEEVRASGLGYSNLLYMATVIVELTKAKYADLTLFLVEEPEAHLHPQLQMLVLDFLLEKAKASFAQPPVAGQPEGRIQVVVSTHSPNLTAWASPNHLVVVRSNRMENNVAATACVPIDKLGLAEPVLNKISRYLDVTRSALLFGNRAALVEGIAEGLLLPLIARKFVLNQERDKDALLRFRGTVLVPIEGVDFRPYVETLLRSYNNTRIADRVVVITDTDPSLPGNRKAELETLAGELGAADKLRVFTNDVTLEFDLFRAGNAEILRRVFLALHPRSEDRWNAEVAARAADQQAAAFVNLLKDTRTRKGDFAQELAARIEADEPFQVPEYIAEAIRAIAEA